MGLILSPAAEADVDEIWDYSADTWGVSQAEVYVSDLRKTMERLAVRPTLGVACPAIRPGYRKQSVGSHVIFYRLVGEDVDIVRVLHQRVDFARHLYVAPLPRRP